jgi:hypothetical protein
MALALFATIFPSSAKAAAVSYALNGIMVDGLLITGGFTLDSTAAEPTVWDITIPADRSLGLPLEEFITGGYNDSEAGTRAQAAFSISVTSLVLMHAWTSNSNRHSPTRRRGT